VTTLLIEQGLVVTAAALVTVGVLMTATALWSRRVGRVAVVDITWGASFVVVAVVSALVGLALGVGDDLRRWLVPVLTGVWGLRLAWHIRGRAGAGEEDPRYAELLGDGGFGVAIRKVFLVQGFAVWLISLPVQASWSSACSSGPSACSSRWSATGSSRRIVPGPGSRARRSWTKGCGPGPVTPTTSATRVPGGGCGSSAAWPLAGCPAC
jgi:hypothetical protein